MKIVNKEEFVNYPDGTIFCYYANMLCYGTWIKLTNTYDENGIVGYDQQSLEPMYEVHFNDVEVEQEGMVLGSINTECLSSFPSDQKFLIYEKEDIKKLKELIGN